MKDGLSTRVEKNSKDIVAIEHKVRTVEEKIGEHKKALADADYKHKSLETWFNNYLKKIETDEDKKQAYWVKKIWDIAIPMILITIGLLLARTGLISSEFFK